LPTLRAERQLPEPVSNPFHFWLNGPQVLIWT
jgi:hypothetical protein